MGKYYRIPSGGPITKMEAYREAMARYRVHYASARQNHAGIVYITFHGRLVFLEWDDLPKPKR